MRARPALLVFASLAALCTLWPAGAGAQEFRTLNPILGPGLSGPLPAGAQRVQQMRTVDRAAVETAIRQIAASWNTPQLAEKLGPQFYDATRLSDVIATRVPRDAKLRVIAVQGLQVLEQHVVPDGSGVFDTYISRVSATVRTQIEFNTSEGFQRRDGTNEFILKVTQRILR